MLVKKICLFSFKGTSKAVNAVERRRPTHIGVPDNGDWGNLQNGGWVVGHGFSGEFHGHHGKMLT